MRPTTDPLTEADELLLGGLPRGRSEAPTPRPGHAGMMITAGPLDLDPLDAAPAARCRACGRPCDDVLDGDVPTCSQSCAAVWQLRLAHAAALHGEAARLRARTADEPSRFLRAARLIRAGRLDQVARRLLA